MRTNTRTIAVSTIALALLGLGATPALAETTATCTPVEGQPHVAPTYKTVPNPDYVPAVEGKPAVTEQRLVTQAVPAQDAVYETVTIPAVPAVPAVYKWQVVVEAVPPVPAVKETRYQFKHKHGGKARWESNPNWNAEGNENSVGWYATGETKQVVVVPAVPGKPAVKEKVEVSPRIPAVPARTEQVLVKEAVPAQEAVYETVVIEPAVEGAPAVGEPTVEVIDNPGQEGIDPVECPAQPEPVIVVGDAFLVDCEGLTVTVTETVKTTPFVFNPDSWTWVPGDEQIEEVTETFELTQEEAVDLFECEAPVDVPPTDVPPTEVPPTEVPVVVTPVVNPVVTPVAAPVAATPIQTDVQHDSLAETGAEPLAMAGLSGLIVAIGAALTLLRRRFAPSAL